MNENTVSVKEEFDNTIKTLEEYDKSKKKMFNTILYTISIFLFLAVLVGTMMSYSNYVKAKEKADKKIQVVELKAVN